jgi:pimeloyl-ACP methyl ester carboxylesterase
MLTNPARRSASSAVAAVLLLIAACGWQPLAAQTPEAGPAQGQLVDIGGHELHLVIAGPAGAGPVVIFEAGAGGTSADWAKLQDALAPRVRTCAYDRAGSGRSQPGPGPRTMRQEVFELRELLRAADVPGPYVLVGHSYGGLLARLFAEKYSQEVAGMVLVDSTHESSVLFQRARDGRDQGRWVRIREQATGRAIPDPRRWAAGEAAQAGDDSQPPLWPEELEALHQARLSNPTPLGERPLVVLAGTRESRPPGPSDEEWAQLREEKDRQRAELALLSRQALLVRDPASGHQIHRDHPELVVWAIERVLAAAQGAPLAP